MQNDRVDRPDPPHGEPTDVETPYWTKVDGLVVSFELIELENGTLELNETENEDQECLNIL